MSEEKSLDFKLIVLKPGTKASLCSCGQSKTIPYCDHSHREVNEKNGTSYKSFKVKNSTDKDIELKVNSGNWPKDNPSD